LATTPAAQRSSRQLPDGVVVITVPELARPTNVYAGLPIANGCTTGFSVAGPQGLGTTTAAHCGNDLGPSLPFIWEWNGWDRDLQWHTAPDQTVRSVAQDGGGQRNITGTQSRDVQFIGEWVCKYGRSTGFGCGAIADKNRTGSGGYDSPTYIRVQNYGYNLSLEGDSGGPWYTDNIALGIMHATLPTGGGYRDAIYMAINYVQSTGLIVLLNCPDGC
jgi:hypothetical protein